VRKATKKPLVPTTREQPEVTKVPEKSPIPASKYSPIDPFDKKEKTP
jgi:hypothetical protein